MADFYLLIMKRLLFLLFILPIVAHAQLRISGIAKDAETKKALRFATVIIGDYHAFADIDGKFMFVAPNAATVFMLSYEGYQIQDVLIEKEKSFYVVLLAKNEEVDVLAHSNAAGIIQRAIRAKNVNNPMRKLKTFEFRAYNKLIVTANPDSVKSLADTLTFRRYFGKRKTKIDTSQSQFKRVVARQHLFETEKVSTFQFNGATLKETIQGTKMSGFRQPIYEILGFNLQSFSIYDESYELFETQYKSPLADNALTAYRYTLIDTVMVGGRMVYVIDYEYKRRRAGLQGLLFIDGESYAVAKAVTRIKGVLDISGTHEFNYISEEKLWFPKTRNFRIVKGNNDDDLRILGGTIRFDAVTDMKSRKKEASDYTYILSETNFSDLIYNKPVTIRKRAIAIEIKNDAISRDENFWNLYRKDSLDIREKNTYLALDSLVVTEKIEKKLRIGRKIINGYIPFGVVDVDLRYLLSYNNYEGFRIGVGGITNDKLSEKYRLEGYTAYGTKDGNFKYSLGGAARIGRFSDTWVGASYTDDVREIASTAFAIDRRVFKLYDPRPINVSTFYNHVTKRAFIETKFIPKTESIWQLTQSWVEPKFEYTFLANGKSYSVFHMATAQVSLQWNPYSDYMQTPKGRLEIEKRFPKFTFQFTQSLKGLLNNDFEFSKLDLRGEYQKNYLNGQKSAVVMEAGFAFGDIPLTHLYNTSPNNLTKDRLLQRITIAGKNSFETMYFNEFFSSQYVMMQLKHGFKRMILLRKIKPALVFVTRMAWGNMQKPEQHQGIDYKTLDKGYFESGIELNQIYSGFGLSGFYRYGPNQLSRVEDNLTIKISFILNLGI